VDKAALWQVFSEQYFGFPCQSFHQFLHHHNHLLVAAVPSGSNWTPPPTPTIPIKKKLSCSAHFQICVSSPPLQQGRRQHYLPLRIQTIFTLGVVSNVASEYLMGQLRPSHCSNIIHSERSLPANAGL
jgi:hypothetical protein